MDFEPSPSQRALVRAVANACAPFDDAYWLERDRSGEFPEELFRAMAEAGVLGLTLPPAYGGSGLGVVEAALVMHEVARSPGAISAASAIHINIFGPQAIVRFGSEEQRARFLPDLAAGRVKTCFGVTEPDAGLDTTRIATRAERQSDGSYLVSGRKIWTTTARQADKILLLARTTPLAETRRPTEGLTLFYADLDRQRVDVREIPKMGRSAVDSNELAIDGLRVAAEDRIGEEGRGFEVLLSSLNPERVLIGIEAVGVGRNALARAARYARERVVFGRPIGQNQGIQHPLAESWCQLEAAYLLCLRAAALYDAGRPCGPEANAAKYLGAEAGFEACTRAVMTHGGMGYAKEYHVERLLREVLIARLAPVSPQLALCHVAEKALGLPKSY
ncbi:MAG TPA: acyl-CoA dehydrogenase family protein [Thermoanaerobaculia bacterium]|nr:acyl-CoA dehydrogenase family protein [Thermoanaerobaculia bacterium]